MAAYHQIGHQSDNLLTAEHLQKYAGWLLSPVNYMPGETAAQIKMRLIRAEPRNNFRSAIVLS